MKEINLLVVTMFLSNLSSSCKTREEPRFAAMCADVFPSWGETFYKYARPLQIYVKSAMRWNHLGGGGDQGRLLLQEQFHHIRLVGLGGKVDLEKVKIVFDRSGNKYVTKTSPLLPDDVYKMYRVLNCG